MEVVGGRLGRLSTRYAPATVFSGPVRKWKKRWIPLSAPNSNAAANANGARSNLLLYKWAPASSPYNGTPQAEEPPPKKFRYVPISVIEEQKQEAAEKLDDENKPVEADPSLQPNQIDSSDTKPDMNNIAVEEAQASDKDQVAAEYSNRTNFDLNLGLKAAEGDRETKSRNAEQDEASDQPDKVSLGKNMEMKSATNSEPPNKLKRKAVAADLKTRV